MMEYICTVSFLNTYSVDHAQYDCIKLTWKVARDVNINIVK